MLPANLITALQTLYGGKHIATASTKPAVAAAPDPAPGNKPLQAGQQVFGLVQNQISEGVFKVQVAGQTLQMRLPPSVQSGSTIKLEVINTQPRITFGLIASSRPLSDAEQIGATARLLSSLADQPLEKATIRQINQPAVWQTSGQVPDSKQLANALQNALSNSGLFYESHQAQWVRGERSITQLLVEPQNQLISTHDTPLSSTAAPATTPDKPTVGESGLPIARELMPLVQQQLHTLETHHLSWRGEVWPGQDMHWEIEEQEPPHPQAERQWRTEMELNLPKLGNVRAQLALNDSGLHLTLHAADSTTLDLFKHDISTLKVALNKADMQLLTAVVKPNES